MATLKLNNTTVFTESNGVASIPSAVKFPAGHVINMEIFHTGTQKTVFSSSYAEDSTTITALSVTINKIYSSSKVWILCSPSIQGYRSSGGEGRAGARIIRGIISPYTEIKDFACVVRSYDGGDVHVTAPIICLQCVDETTLTGNLTYTLELKNINGSDARLNIDVNNEAISTITAFEIM